jgi:4'-phosphopantetheinyl transferase
VSGDPEQAQNGCSMLLRETCNVSRLGEDEVHVWLAFPDAINAAGLLAAYDRLMTEEERRRQQRFRFDKGRHECLVTRALCRTTLSRYVDIPPQDWRFVKGSHGRPELPAGFCDLPLHFNLSHTGGLIACSVTLDRDVGVDVEDIDRKGKTMEIADRVFSSIEVRELRALPEQRQRSRFFDYWTLKESYIKARGLGLAIALDQFSFHLGEHGPVQISFDPRLDDDPSIWQFARFRPTERHRMAVCVRRGSGPDLRIIVRNTVPLAD